MLILSFRNCSSGIHSPAATDSVYSINRAQRNEEYHHRAKAKGPSPRRRRKLFLKQRGDFEDQRTVAGEDALCEGAG
jgi:hypothetical protein